MQITKDSWHYKLVRNSVWRESQVPTNICPYMRKVVWQSIKAAAKWTGIGMFFAFAGAALIAPLVSLVNHFAHFLPEMWTDTPSTMFGFFVTLGIACYVLAACVVAWAVGNNFLDEYRIKRRAREIARAVDEVYEPLVPKPPGLFATYIKGMREKTCIGLEFVDSEPAAE